MESQLSCSLAKFAFSFCNELGTDKTTICSPLSAEVLLAMTALSCKGQSHAELMQALDIPSNEVLRSSFGRLTSTLQSVKGVRMKMASKIFLKNSSKLIPGIEKDAKKVLKSKIKQLDFCEGENAARVINKWVEKKSNGLIRDIISAGSLNQTTGLLLVNAIYFKRKWKIPFSANKTLDRTFFLNKSTNIKVPMMYKEEIQTKYGVVTNLNAKLLQMDYKGNDASMVIVLPDDIEGLNDVMQQLTKGYPLMADVEALRESKVDVMIPKFKAEMTIDLKKLSPKMGIKSIFDAVSSDIAMLKSNERLYVSEAIQKAYIEVNESGTEAAVVTSVHSMMLCGRMRPPCRRFIADRPFLYLLIVRSIPVFVGVYEGSGFKTSATKQ